MKIKINSLPQGMTIEDGKLVPMKEGGMTGDQSELGLTTIPTRVSGSEISDENDKDVRYSLSSVPRDEANLEAEGGETVLTDLSGDGQFGLYNIKGPRHSNGGVPMFLPEQSFIYSDTKALKMKGEELKEFGIGGRKSKTPADISKKFELNKYYGAIEDEYADDIQVKSADIMLKKNKYDLSKLAFGQELKKDFEDGVPLAAHPYLMSIGQDPIEFTAKVEEISQQKAQEKAFNALPPQEQMKIMMLQQLMAQQEQGQTEGQMQPQQDMEEPALADLPMAQRGIPRRKSILDNMDSDGDGIPNYQDPFPYVAYDPNASSNNQSSSSSTSQNNTSTPTNNTTNNTTDPVNTDDNTDPVLQSLIGGSPDYLEYYMDDGYASERERRYNAYKNEMDRAGKKPVDETTYHKRYLDIQKFNFEIQKFASENPDLDLDLTSKLLDRNFNTGVAGSKELERIIKLYNDTNKDSEGFTELKMPDKETVTTFQEAYTSTAQSAAALEFQKMKNGEEFDEEVLSKFFIGSEDDNFMGVTTGGAEKIPNPNWKPGDNKKYQFIYVSKPDGLIGNNTINQNDKINIAKTYKPVTETPEDPDDPETPLEPGEDPVEKAKPDADFWLQDLIKMGAIANRERELFLPWQPEVEDIDVNYDLLDPTRTIAAINETANIGMSANNMYSGPQAGSARNTAIVGKTMKGIADAVNDIQAKNVGIVNRGEYQNAMIDMRINRERRDRNVKEYDGTTLALQNYMDEKNFDREQYANAYANALTNRANTYNMNLTQDYFTIDPMTGGMIGQTGSRAFEAVQPVDNQEAYLRALDQYSRRYPKAGAPSENLIKLLAGVPTNNYQTNIQAEYNRLTNNPNTNVFGYQGNNTSMTTGQNRRGGEKKLKRMAVPFYSGTMLP